MVNRNLIREFDVSEEDWIDAIGELAPDDVSWLGSQDVDVNQIVEGKIIRIGHMGDITNEDMLALFAALAEGSDHWLQSSAATAKWQSLASQVESQLKRVDKLFP